MTTGRWNPMGQRFEPDSTPSLASFLLARFAEDEAAVREIDSGFDWDPRAQEHRGAEGRGIEWIGGAEWADSYRLAVPSARVRADLDAKRRIVELRPNEDEWRDEGEQGSEYCVENPAWTTWTEVLKLLALPYVDHLDYRQEWRP